MKRLWASLSLALSALLLNGASAWAQCSVCRQAIRESGQEGLVRGLQWSVVFMLAVPLVMVGTISFLIVRSIRRQKAVQQQELPLSTHFDPDR